MAVATSKPEQPITPVRLEPEFQLTEGQLEATAKNVWLFFAGPYEPYRPKAIERIQRALKARGLYDGSVNGVLDKPTMKAIYAFQRTAGTLQISGVPAPRTRGSWSRDRTRIRNRSYFFASATSILVAMWLSLPASW